MPQAVGEAECVVKENCHVKVNEVAAILGMNHGSVHHIIHDVLQFCKVGG
jgi:hypothetical protein